MARDATGIVQERSGAASEASSTDLVDEDVRGVRLDPGPLRPTRRMLVVPTLGLVLWAAGSNAGAGFLVVLAGGLMATVPWAWFTARRAARTVRVRREMPRRVVAGADFAATLHVHAASNTAVVVHDELLEAVGVVEDAAAGAALRHVGSLTRGIVDRATVTVEVTDPFGLFRSSVAGAVPARIDVLPPAHLAPVGALASAARRASEDRPRRRGQGAEADGTREYRYGDSPRSVDWRSTARRDKLVVREFVGDASGHLQVTLVPGDWTRTALDAACLVAATVAESCLRAGSAVTLGVGDVAVPWSNESRHLLASLAPHLGAPVGRGLPSIEVGALAHRSADLELVLAPVAGGCEVEFVGDGTRRSIGRLPKDADDPELLAWVARTVTTGPPT